MSNENQISKKNQSLSEDTSSIQSSQETSSPQPKRYPGLFSKDWGWVDEHVQTTSELAKKIRLGG